MKELDVENLRSERAKGPLASPLEGPFFRSLLVFADIGAGRLHEVSKIRDLLYGRKVGRRPSLNLVRLKILTLTIPALGVLAGGLALVLGSSGRPVSSAEVYGGPTDVEGPWFGRLFVSRQHGGVSEPLRFETIEVRRKGVDHERTVFVTTDGEGWVDLELPAVRGAGLSLRIFLATTGQVLAEGRPVFSSEKWRTARHRGLALPEARKMGLSIRQGVLAVPFIAEVVVHEPDLCRAGAEDAGFGAHIELGGGEFLQGEAPAVGLRTLQFESGDGPRVVGLRAAEHVMSWEVRCGSEAPGQGEARAIALPVVPGAVYPRFESQRLIIASPIPRDVVYYTIVTGAARLAGGRVLLAPAADGSYSGEFGLDRLPKLPDRYLVLSPARDGRSPATVGYPLDEQEQTFDALDGFLLDGAPDALAREARRRERFRTILLGYAAALLALTLGLFHLLIAAADKQLLRSLWAHGGQSTAARSRKEAPLVVAGLVLAGGLSLLLVWIAVFEAPR